MEIGNLIYLSFILSCLTSSIITFYISNSLLKRIEKLEQQLKDK